MKRAVYAGSFDPFTNGHLNIYNQAKEIFDVTILIAENPNKKRFTDTYHIQDVVINTIYKRENYKDENGYYENLNVMVYKGLVADYCNQNNIKYLIRGLRNTSDYLYEEEIAKINQEIYPDLKTIYFRSENGVISSSMVRLFYEQGKDISKYVPSKTLEMLRNVESLKIKY